MRRERTREEKEQVKLECERSLQNFYRRPIGDTSRFYEQEYAKVQAPYFAAINEDAPLTAQEEKLLEPEPATPQWVRCRRCGVEWKSSGCVLLGKSIYPTICNPCADWMDARRVTTLARPVARKIKQILPD